ncbi:MAG: beta-N-acetylhexosaminidase [Myxococcaceae bacterium]
MNPKLATECARLVVVGFPSTEVDAELSSLIRVGVGGAILFRRNIESFEQARDLCAGLKSDAARPFVLSVDQEGGRVARLRGEPFTALPSMRALAAKNDVSLAERVGRLLAYELRAVGFDWDFAPVLDVDSNPKNPVIGDRAFADTPERVSEFGIALARGLEAGGVASCGKHFPGHGDASQDSHLVLPRLPHALDRLRRVELPPFAAYAKARLASLMTAHVVFDALDPRFPATMSAPVLRILREELGFSGVLVSDDLEMKAVASHFPIEDAIVMGINAGIDVFLICHHADVQMRAIEALVHAVEDGRVPRARLVEAHARFSALIGKFVQPADSARAALGSPQHRELAFGLGATEAGRDPTEVLV